MPAAPGVPVQHGASAAYSSSLQSESAGGAQTMHAARAARRAASASSKSLIAVGYVLASLLGVAGGYYLLCALNPQANFLNLQLPGLRQPAGTSHVEINKNSR